MDDYIRNLSMSSIMAQRINVEQSIELLNRKEAVLLDVRYPYELDVWEFKPAKFIPLNELPDRLDEIPKDKIIVCACPLEVRSNIACQYLIQKGFNAKYLIGGLLSLIDRLKGAQAKDLKIS
ncbi:MAG: rhodanese-like domain-containing protein [Thermodesulfovibrionales bacterium]|nr:rhodanese-like domain-containing protein [Thermodesulfovibrionales bacterium]